MRRPALSLSKAGLSHAPPRAVEHGVALSVILVSALAFVAVAPFARVPLTRSDAFIPLYQSALFINDLITAILLFSQFAQHRTRALLALGCGYLFDALIIIPHTLSFPGVFAPQGLMGSGPQTTAWLYSFWHGGFALFVLAYAALAHRGKNVESVGGALTAGIAAVVALVIAIAVLCTSGHDALPIVMQGGDYSLLISKGVSPAICVFTILALCFLWPRRKVSILDLWLIVVMCVWLCDVGLSAVVGSNRFDLGFYAGRSYGLLAASFLLGAMLLEMHRLYGHLGTALDVAERRNEELIKSREQLARAQRLEAMGQLTGGVAHDFNNMLTIVSGSLDLILHSPNNVQLVERLARAAREASGRGARLTKQLLTFSSRQIQRPETVNLNRLLGDFDRLLRGAVGESVEIRSNLNSTLDSVRIDPSEFEAAILNLAVNAKEAMPNGGRITIGTDNVVVGAENATEELKPGAYIVISVGDEGRGMSPEVLGRAIDPFFTTKEVGGGSGLGLSQVYGFARSSGGHVALESTPGAGTTVRIFLPRHAGAIQPPPPSIVVPPACPTEDGITVLVVEDDPGVRMITVEGLNALGYRVLTAGNAAEALAMIRKSDEVDVVFSDVVMPGGTNGAQLALEARRIRPKLKVLLTSGYAASVLTRDHGIPGDLELLGKPYQQQELAQKLRLVMSA